MKDAVNTIFYFSMFALVAFFCTNVLAMEMDGTNTVLKIYDVKEKETVVVRNNRVIEYYEEYHEELETKFEEKKALEEKARQEEEERIKREEQARIEEERRAQEEIARQEMARQEALRAQAQSMSVQSAEVGSKQEIANFALQFVGNPYVAGGNSLTSGTDCSGFVRLVYENFGVSLPRIASEQSYVGEGVSVDNIQVGDIVSYGYNGVVSHSALYVGNGQIVHAATPALGIRIDNLYMMPIIAVRRVIS